MKKYFFILLTIVGILYGCESKPTTNTRINGRIRGLKKGTLYLSKIKNHHLVNIDSIVLNEKENFEFNLNLKEPEVLYIRLKEKPLDEILIFAEKGNNTVVTDLYNFIPNIKITGSENQQILDQYNRYVQREAFRNADLIKTKLEALKNKNVTQTQALEEKYQQSITRTYLFTLNYLHLYNNHEVAPYIAITQLENANPALLQKIYRQLTPKIKQSNYGKILKAFCQL